MPGMRLFTSGKMTSSLFFFSNPNKDKTKFLDLPAFGLLSDPTTASVPESQRSLLSARLAFLFAANTGQAALIEVYATVIGVVIVRPYYMMLHGVPGQCTAVRRSKQANAQASRASSPAANRENGAG